MNKIILKNNFVFRFGTVQGHILSTGISDNDDENIETAP